MRWRRAACASTAPMFSPPCAAPSRMSYYTGRYVHSHGASWNFVPLKAGEMTIGDHLRPLGVRSVLVGKTHMRADLVGHGAPRHRPELDDRRAHHRMRLRPLRARRRHPSLPRATTRARATTTTCANTALVATTPGKPGPTPPMATTATIRSGWFLKYCERARRACPTNTPRRRTSRAARWISSARPATQPWVPARVLHQAALALHRARALRRHVHSRRMRCRSCAPSASGLTRIRFIAPS